MPNPERYIHAKRVFLEAERLPKGERSRFIRVQCGDDQELETQVRRLLVADQEEPEFLETPALARGGATEIAPGTQLGRFRIIKQLGEGGMGVVYEAEEDEPRRRIALKVIRPGVVTERLRSRFRQEIRVLGQLRHPGIAQIYEASTFKLGTDLVPYFSMELIAGPPLLRFAEDRALTLQERLILIAQVCDAAHHAHQKAVIHRDLKPGNILVEDAPSTDSSSTSTAAPFQIKILDFGIARAADTDIQTITIQTEPGQLIGTIPYMSPEQVSGQTDAVDIRSDVYSIGVIAFELLAGRLPYAIRDRLLPEAVRMIHEAEPTRLGSIDRTFRGDIETIIGKALEKDRQHRYQSAADMAADIRRYLRDEPIIARPASAMYQLRKFARRHRPLVAAAGLVFVAMTAATAISVWKAGVARRAEADAEKQQLRADRSAEEARREAKRATLAAVAAAADAGEPITARRMLDGVAPEMRDWPWRYWDSRLDQSIANFHPAGGVAGLWIDPGGQEVVVLTRDGRVVRGSPWSDVWNDEKAGVRLPGDPFAMAVFTDGARQVIAISGDKRNSLDVYDTRDGTRTRHAVDLDAAAGLLEASRDGKVVVVGIKRQVHAGAADDTWILRTNETGPASTARQAGRTSGMTLSPDGRWLGLGLSSAKVLDTTTLDSTITPELRLGELQVAITSDGRWIAGGGADKTIRIWDRASSRELHALKGHPGVITALAFDPSGQRLASAGVDMTIRLWDTQTGRMLRVLTGHTGRIRKLSFCDDGSSLVSVANDGTVRLWKPDPYEGVSILRGHENYVYAVALTPDGSRIVSGAWDQKVKLWDAASGRDMATLHSDRGFVTAVAVSADAATIAAAHKANEWRAPTIVLWDAVSGSPRDFFNLGRGEVDDLVLARDGSRLWMNWEHGGAGSVDLRASRFELQTLAQANVRSIALSPDERELACGWLGGTVALIDAATGQERLQLKGHKGWVPAVAFHPRLQILASASVDGTARLWDLDTGQCTAVLDRHWGKVFALAFSPDGELLATGSDDTTIRLWEVSDGQELTQLRGHEAYVYSLAFSPDGTRLVSGSGDRTVRIWDTRPVHERWRAAQHGR